MEKYYVVYNQDTVAVHWCWEDEVAELTKNHGWSLYAVADNEFRANELAEEACYI